MIEMAMQNDLIFWSLWMRISKEWDSAFPVCSFNDNIPSISNIHKLIDMLNVFVNKHTEEDIIKHNHNNIISKWISITKNWDYVCWIRVSKNERMGIRWYVYLIKDGDAYKIWRTKNKEARFKKFFTENIRACVIHSYESYDYIEEEKRLHDLYKDKRIKWERFSLTEEDIAYIKTL
jgi:hypothetical protein